MLCTIARAAMKTTYICTLGFPLVQQAEQRPLCLLARPGLSWHTCPLHPVHSHFCQVATLKSICVLLLIMLLITFLMKFQILLSRPGTPTSTHFTMHLDTSGLECWLILNKYQRQSRALLNSCQMPNERYFCILSYVIMFNVNDNNLTYHLKVIYSRYKFVVYNPKMANLEHKWRVSPELFFSSVGTSI